MIKIKLKDLYFIENVKNRKAFLKALQEIEDEGFEISNPNLEFQKIKDIENENKEIQSGFVGTNDGVGKTPREFAKSNNVVSVSKKFTNTNAVDLKDYKYWRDDELKKEKPEKNVSSSLSKSDFSSNGKSASLYDELFGGIPEHKVQKQEKKTDNIKFLDDLFDEKDTKLTTDDDLKKKTKLIDGLLEEDDKINEPNDDDFIKSMMEMQAIRESVQKKPVVKKSTSQTKNTKSTKSPFVKSSKNAEAKVLVPEKAKTATSTKPKKAKKKKLDADIKLYKKIRLD